MLKWKQSEPIKKKNESLRLVRGISCLAKWSAIGRKQTLKIVRSGLPE